MDSKTLANSPFSLAQYAFFHSVGARESSPNAAFPILRSTAGAITKGPMPIESSDSFIDAASVAKT